MASFETWIRIYNQTQEDLSLSVSEIENRDWDGNSRPDKNLNGRNVPKGAFVDEREEINTFCSTNWFRLTVRNKNNQILSVRINQRLARKDSHSAANHYTAGGIIYTFTSNKLRRNNKDYLVLSISDEKLPTTILDFSAGAYPILGGQLDHTYVFTAEKNDKEINFPCWGGTDRKTTKITREGDLELAIAICCSNPYDRRTNYNRRSVDNSGITYGVTGVCHQMANRIMYAMDGKPTVKDFTPSFGFSFWAYGYYGLHKGTDKDWETYLLNCQEKVNRARGSIKETEEVAMEGFKNNLLERANKMDDFTKKAIFIEVNHGGEENLPDLRLKLLIDTAFPQGYDSAKMETIMEKNHLFHEKHLEMAEEIEEETNSKVNTLDFADKANAVFVQRLEAIYDILGDEDFEKVFGMKFNKEFKMINKDFINDAE